MIKSSQDENINAIIGEMMGVVQGASQGVKYGNSDRLFLMPSRSPSERKKD